MWWYGRENSGGSRLPEEKKANMWPGRGKSGGSWPPAFPRSFNITIQLTDSNRLIYYYLQLLYREVRGILLYVVQYTVYIVLCLTIKI